MEKPKNVLKDKALNYINKNEINKNKKICFVHHHAHLFFGMSFSCQLVRNIIKFMVI